ncbi:MAG: ABC transporter permease [Anaerolinea sp.]|nr:ABC transporter permease [Anaerolinea sp.]
MTQTESVTQSAPSQVSVLRQRLKCLRQSYIVRVLIQGFFTIWLTMTVTFLLIRGLPGDAKEIKINQIITQQNVTYDEAAAIAAGLLPFDPDAPILEQYTDYLGKLLRFNLGESITSAGTPVLSQIFTFLPWTLFSVGSGLLISFTLGTLMGMAIAYWRGSWLDNVVTFFASILYGIPDFVIAFLIILIGGVQLGLFKPGSLQGGSDPGIEPGFTAEYIGSLLRHVFLPLTTYVATTIGGWILTMKSSTISTLGEDYIAVAQARGLSQRRILLGYVGRNAMLPQVTRLAISIGFVLGGSVIIETIFNYPGLGRLLSNSIVSRDYTTMQGVFLTISSAVIISNIFADLLYSVLDPRVRLGGKKS